MTTNLNSSLFFIKKHDCDDMLCCISNFEQVDFLSVHIEYNCASASDLAKELRSLQVIDIKHFSFEFAFDIWLGY